MLDVIAKRIKDIRTENNLTQAEFGKILSVSQDNVSLWENAKSTPSVQCIILMSKTFNVTSDFILGLSDF